MTIQSLTQYFPAFLDGFGAYALLGLCLIWGAVLLNYSLPMAKDPLHLFRP
jgi:putative oxidoreductase